MQYVETTETDENIIQEIETERIITYKTKTLWPEDYPGMTLQEAVKYEMEKDDEEILEEIYGEPINKCKSTVRIRRVQNEETTK